MKCLGCGLVQGFTEPGFRCGFCGSPVSDGYHVIYPRRGIGPAMRRRVFAASSGLCAYCGATLDPNRWHADHVVPWSRGGPTEEGNLVASCPPCNMAKHDYTGEEWTALLQAAVRAL